MIDEDAGKLAALLQESQTGDPHALHLLCKRLEGYLRGYFLKRFQDRSVVDDLCQETYVRLLNNLHAIKDGRKLRGFVTKVAIHVTQDYLREKYRKKDRSPVFRDPEDDNGIHSLRALLSDDPSGSRHDVQLLDKIDLENALGQLTQKSRTVLLMKAHGYNYQEISDELGISVSAAKMQIKRSIDMLRTTLLL